MSNPVSHAVARYEVTPYSICRENRVFSAQIVMIGETRRMATKRTNPITALMMFAIWFLPLSRLTVLKFSVIIQFHIIQLGDVFVSVLLDLTLKLEDIASVYRSLGSKQDHVAVEFTSNIVA